MKVGIALNMLCQAGRSDASVVGEHLALGDLAEPLGFDSLFALEHHFTGYAMSPSPLQLLSYYAGRTKRITLGTSVIVLPWHDPIRVAEQIALLDILCGGRCMFAFGRSTKSSNETTKTISGKRVFSSSMISMARHQRYAAPRKLFRPRRIPDEITSLPFRISPMIRIFRRVR